MTIHKDFDLSQSLWYKLGGKTKYLLVCHNKEDILEALAFIEKEKITNIFIFGLGSNVIFAKENFDGAVIQITTDAIKQQINIDEKGLVEVFAGELLDSVITFSLDNKFRGLEWAGGLPGTVGAAVRGNVGAYGGEIKDSLVNIDILDYSYGTPVLKTLTNEELSFSYRTSLIKTHKKLVVITARFGLKKANEAEIEAATDVYHRRIEQREENHPLEYPNCGSVFKNLRDSNQIAKVLLVYPDLAKLVEKKWYGKIAVASLIERFGLKGFRVGNAQVSEKHALFIVNLGGATDKDVLQIIDTIQQKFQDTFGFKLETEVEIVK